jgi:hypothetical protein
MQQMNTNADNLIFLCSEIFVIYRYRHLCREGEPERKVIQIPMKDLSF